MTFVTCKIAFPYKLNGTMICYDAHYSLYIKKKSYSDFV